MSYSQWIEKSGFLAKLVTDNKETFTQVFNTVNAACNQTLEVVSKTCTGNIFNYQCSNLLSKSRMTLFSCAGYVANGCSINNASCQTAGLPNPDMDRCLHTGMQNYARMHNMTCYPDDNISLYWLLFGLGMGVPAVVISLSILIPIWMKPKQELDNNAEDEDRNKVVIPL